MASQPQGDNPVWRKPAQELHTAALGMGGDIPAGAFGQRHGHDDPRLVARPTSARMLLSHPLLGYHTTRFVLGVSANRQVRIVGEPEFAAAVKGRQAG